MTMGGNFRSPSASADKVRSLTHFMCGANDMCDRFMEVMNSMNPRLDPMVLIQNININSLGDLNTTTKMNSASPSRKSAGR